MLDESRKQLDWVRILLIAIALLYAFLAGLHTVDDLDLGWQMATARYIFLHHHFPSTTLFNYTVPGRAFIYPPFSGIIFYLVHLAGGYAALSWLHAIACAGTIALLVYDGGKATAALAILAVPAIMFRTNLRADLFSVVLFAALASGLWRYYNNKPFRLWLLPVCLLLWANLHPGFIFGFGMLGAYALFEMCDMIFRERRTASLARIRKAAPWIIASAPVTLINPWGTGLYEAVLRQGKLTAFQTAFVTEWSGVQFNARALYQALHPRDPVSGDWWFMALGVLTILAFLWKKRFGPAIFIAALLYISIRHLRFQTVYAIAVVVLGGAALPDLGEIASRVWWRIKGREGAVELVRAFGTFSVTRLAAVARITAVALLAALSTVRAYDLVSNRYFVDGLPTALFGPGLSWWFPERATAFLIEHKLPGNVFHDFNAGGYLTWRIGVQYPDFGDGRVIPFADRVMDEQKRIASLLPDSRELREEADRWNLQTMLFSVGRFAGLGSFPMQEYCKSRNWKLVYFDDVSMIFVRNTAGNQDLIARFGQNCRTAHLSPPTLAIGNSLRAKGEGFNFLMNASSIFFLLERDSEAWATIEEAEMLFPGLASVHLIKGQFLAAENHSAEAEAEYVQALRLDPCDECWHALARLYASEHRYREAEHALQQAATMSLVPYERVRSLGQLYLLMNEPQAALASFARAESISPYHGDAADQGRQFRALLAEGRARAYRQLNEMDRAVAEQETAVRLGPENGGRWIALADLYQAQGQTEKAARTREKAEALQREAAGLSEAPEPAEKH
jgi:tetratricopeptide (TPR) repeat protein